MESTQGKYDSLITALLPMHKRLLRIENDITALQTHITDLKEYIDPYDSRAGRQLFNLFKMLNLAQKASDSDKKRIFFTAKGQALRILETFFYDLEPEEMRPLSMPNL